MQQVRRGLEMAPAAEEEQNNNEDKVLCLHSVRTLCMTACNIYHNVIYYMVSLYSDLSICRSEKDQESPPNEECKKMALPDAFLMNKIKNNFI